MSINWVMLDPKASDFVRLPHEKSLHTTPNRTSLTLSTPNKYPGKEPLHIKSSDGKAIITNQRLIYLPSHPTSTLQSFSAPLLSLNDTHAIAPFFGPNTWEALLTPTPSGGLPPQHAIIALKLTFKEGGAFDFSTVFEQIKEKVGQAVEVARMNGAGGPEGVDLEPLPRYEEAAGTSQGQSTVRIHSTAPGIQRPVPVSPNGMTHPARAPPAMDGVFSASAVGEERIPVRNNEAIPPPPDEPPPGYEEVQAGSVAEGLERSMRDRNAKSG